MPLYITLGFLPARHDKFPGYWIILQTGHIGPTRVFFKEFNKLPLSLKIVAATSNAYTVLLKI